MNTINKNSIGNESSDESNTNETSLTPIGARGILEFTDESEKEEEIKLKKKSKKKQKKKKN